MILLLTSCGSNNIEDQVDEIIRTSEKEEINEIAYSLADSLDVKASKLLIDLHPKQTIKPDGTTDFIAIATERRVRWALQGIMSRYSGIKNSKISSQKRMNQTIAFITAAVAVITLIDLLIAL